MQGGTVYLTENIGYIENRDTEYIANIEYEYTRILICEQKTWIVYWNAGASHTANKLSVAVNTGSTIGRWLPLSPENPLAISLRRTSFRTAI